MYTDSHCHLFKEYYDDIEEVIEKAQKAGVTKFITCGCDYKTNLEVLNLCGTVPNVYGAIGIHPTEISHIYKNIKLLRESVNNKKIIAVGEIGLDYHYQGTKKLKQKIVFNLMLKIAKKYNKPVIVHSRDANKDTYEILKKYQLKGVIHSFSGDLDMAQKYIELGYLIGVNGTVTFKNSNLVEILKVISIDRALLETDSPYLSPAPFRGEKNEPKNILEIVEFLSKNLSVKKETLALKMAENIHRLFDI